MNFTWILQEYEHSYGLAWNDINLRAIILLLRSRLWWFIPLPLIPLNMYFVLWGTCLLHVSSHIQMSVVNFIYILYLWWITCLYVNLFLKYPQKLSDVLYLGCTEYHLGQLKAKLAKLRTQLLEPPKVCDFDVFDC